MKPTMDAMEESLAFLSATDLEYAKACALVEGLREQSKTIRAVEFFKSRENSATAREMDALRSPQYSAHLLKIENAHAECAILKERRSTAELIIRCWQCLNAARTKGFVT